MIFIKKMTEYFICFNVYNDITQYSLTIGFGKINENYIITNIKKEQNIICQN